MRAAPWRLVLRRTRADWLMVAAAWLVMELLQSVVRTEGVTAVVATHDPLLLDIADRVLELRDGKLTELPTGEPADRVLRRYAPPTI